MPENRTLIITGASSGIGRALAVATAREGDRVVLVARRAERLAEIASGIRAAGGACATVAADVIARDTPAKVVAAALQSFGRIDAVVNNAGSYGYGGLLQQSDAALEAQWQLHVAAPLRLSRAALPHLEATHGQLVFIGSGVARVPLPNAGAYSLAKAAIRAAAIQLRRELRARGVAVTYVDPGVVATEFHSSQNIERPPGGTLSAERAARAILRGMRRRAAVVTAAPWQTAFTILAEWSGTLADRVVTRAFTVRRAPEASANFERVTATSSPRAESRGEETSFAQALEPVARRMERVKLPASFLRDALVPGAMLQLGELAMRWAGMPNKNERAAMREVLDALTAGGYLEQVEEETWRVLRAAD
jgi:short-subunit dehydrogenase